MAKRRKLSVSVLSAFLSFAFSLGSKAYTKLHNYIAKKIHQATQLYCKEDRLSYLPKDVDTATSATQVPKKHASPELEIYCYLLVLIFLIDQKEYSEAKACATAGIA